MAQVTARPRLAGHSPISIGVDRVWRFFCSVRAAVYEIIALALLVLIGTLAGSSVPFRIAKIVPATQPVVDRWYAWDVFHSVLFMALLALIATAIAICTLNRAPAIWSAITHPTVHTTHGFLRTTETAASMSSDQPAALAGSWLAGAMRERHYRVLTVQRGDEVHLYADKNRFARLGTFPFHLALILILVGGIVGARYGYREKQFVVPEGSVRPLGHGTTIDVRLDSFSDAYREDGSAKEFRSELALLDGDKIVKTGAITVNHPMTYHNIVFYQSGFGQAVVLKVTGPHGEPLYEDALPLGLFESRTNADAPAGVLELPQAGAALNVIAPDQNPANSPELDTLGLRSGELFVQYRSRDPLKGGAPVSAVIGQGQQTKLNGLSITFVRERRFTSLQVAHNPGIPVFFLAALLLVGGLAITFYFPHRRVRAIVSSQGTRSVTTLAPLARRDWSGKRDFDRLLDDLRREGARIIERRAPSAENDVLSSTATAD